MIEWIREQALLWERERQSPNHYDRYLCISDRSIEAFIDWLERTGATPTMDVAERLYIEAAIAAL